MKIPATLLGIIVVCYSCSSTNLMSLTVTEPAPVSLPPNAKTAAVVNRTRPADDGMAADGFHRTVSLENRDLLTVGGDASVTGLTDALIRSNRFASVKAITNLDLRPSGAGVFPLSLPWDTVEKICSENHADVLFSLELFDADYKVSLNIALLSQGSNVNRQVRTGWRIYDPSTRSILDQYFINRDMVFQSGTFFGAGSSSLDRKEVVIKAGNCAGGDYATRIAPYYCRVSRVYYVRGNGSFSVAMRMARASDWDGAGKIWLQATNNTSRKVAGRACYNMAIISEINGDLNGAIHWAQKAYEVYRTSYALGYVNILQQRQTNDAVLRSQSEVTSTP